MFYINPPFFLVQYRSIEFDKDQEYFATAGVTKKIKIFNYNTIMEQPNVDSHPSEREMVSISKIRCAPGRLCV